MARLGGFDCLGVCPVRHCHLPGVLPVRSLEVSAPAVGSQGSPEAERTAGGGAASEERESNCRRLLLGDTAGGSQGTELLAAPLGLIAHCPVAPQSAADRHLLPADADLHDLQLLALLGRGAGTGTGLLLLRLEQEESRRERVLSLSSSSLLLFFLFFFKLIIFAIVEKLKPLSN